MKSAIDMSKPNALYMAGIGLLMLVSLTLSNVPWLAPSNYFHVPQRALVSAACFALGGALGLVTFWRHSQRCRAPWKVPQVQVSVSYAAFFVVTLAAVALSR